MQEVQLHRRYRPQSRICWRIWYPCDSLLRQTRRRGRWIRALGPPQDRRRFRDSPFRLRSTSRTAGETDSFAGRSGGSNPRSPPHSMLILPDFSHFAACYRLAPGFLGLAAEQMPMLVLGAALNPQDRDPARKRPCCRGNSRLAAGAAEPARRRERAVPGVTP
jgi:hypothetical protein